MEFIWHYIAIIFHNSQITCVNVVHDMNVGTFVSTDYEFTENDPMDLYQPYLFVGWNSQYNFANSF